MFDHACCLSLLTAIVVQWLKDANGKPEEVPQLAEFLDVPPAVAAELAARKVQQRHVTKGRSYA